MIYWKCSSPSGPFETIHIKFISLEFYSPTHKHTHTHKYIHIQYTFIRIQVHLLAGYNIFSCATNRGRCSSLWSNAGHVLTAFMKQYFQQQLQILSQFCYGFKQFLLFFFPPSTRVVNTFVTFTQPSVIFSVTLIVFFSLMVNKAHFTVHSPCFSFRTVNNNMSHTYCNQDSYKGNSR